MTPNTLKLVSYAIALHATPHCTVKKRNDKGKAISAHALKVVVNTSWRQTNRTGCLSICLRTKMALLRLHFVMMSSFCCLVHFCVANCWRLVPRRSFFITTFKKDVLFVLWPTRPACISQQRFQDMTWKVIPPPPCPIFLQAMMGTAAWRCSSLRNRPISAFAWWRSNIHHQKSNSVE